jgi:hypothetical protein
VQGLTYEVVLQLLGLLAGLVAARGVKEAGVGAAPQGAVAAQERVEAAVGQEERAQSVCRPAEVHDEHEHVVAHRLETQRCSLIRRCLFFFFRYSRSFGRRHRCGFLLVTSAALLLAHRVPLQPCSLHLLMLICSEVKFY